MYVCVFVYGYVKVWVSGKMQARFQQKTLKYSLLENTKHFLGELAPITQSSRPPIS